ncbi:GNAT family N-acetyltransferase [Citricoccus sp. NR2]|uniref:GNAT family N-acetyltransferase n=1 Tax=Citricoccus sp. NR2 TaxID=3004095 RepID=UPI0022DE5CEF|nr:N-acetyltransferase [Citricoccus sp. NR2]WBL19253.1 N-acetyltransferase [Citricoccus sp. NR2]
MSGLLWRTRSENDDSPEDRRMIRRVLEAAFHTTAEADLIDALREDPEHWISRYSIIGMTTAIPDSELETTAAAHAVLHRCTISGADAGAEAGAVTATEALMLAPSGVLPQHHGEGGGTAVIEAALAAAQADGAALVIVYGFPDYYPRFGFVPAADHGITAEFADQPEALQVRILAADVPVPSGQVRLPAAYGV